MRRDWRFYNCVCTEGVCLLLTKPDNLDTFHDFLIRSVCLVYLAGTHERWDIFQCEEWYQKLSQIVISDYASSCSVGSLSQTPHSRRDGFVLQASSTFGMHPVFSSVDENMYHMSPGFFYPMLKFFTGLEFL